MERRPQTSELTPHSVLRTGFHVRSSTSELPRTRPGTPSSGLRDRSSSIKGSAGPSGSSPVPTTGLQNELRLYTKQKAIAAGSLPMALLVLCAVSILTTIGQILLSLTTLLQTITLRPLNSAIRLSTWYLGR